MSDLISLSTNSPSAAVQVSRIASQVDRSQVESETKSASDKGYDYSNRASSNPTAETNDTRNSSTNPDNYEVQQNGSNQTTSQAPASDSLVGVSTYNYLGQANTLHPGSGHVLNLAA